MFSLGRFRYCGILTDNIEDASDNLLVCRDYSYLSLALYAYRCTEIHFCVEIMGVPVYIIVNVYRYQIYVGCDSSSLIDYVYFALKGN